MSRMNTKVVVENRERVLEVQIAANAQLLRELNVCTPHEQTGSNPSES
jgi:hypothetical protein